MQQEEQTLAALGIRVVVVTFERGPLARAYVEETGLTYPVLVDESRALYEAYGMLRASRWAIWGPRTWWAYAREFARGRRPLTDREPSDVHQLGGDVLVDPTGRLRLVFVGSGPGDRPSIRRIVAARRM